MQQISLIKKRILQYIDNQGLTRYKFYKDSGITRGVMEKDSGITEDNIAKFIAYAPDVNLRWLILGEGEMIRKINEPQETIEVEKEDQTPCDEIKIIAKERAYIIDLQKDKIEMQNKIIEDLELKLQKLKKEEESIERHSEKPTLLEI